MDYFERTVSVIERIGLPTVALIAMFVLSYRGSRWLAANVVVPWISAVVLSYRVLSEGQNDMRERLRGMEGEMRELNAVIRRLCPEKATTHNRGST